MVSVFLKSTVVAELLQALKSFTDHIRSSTSEPNTKALIKSLKWLLNESSKFIRQVL